MGLFKKVLPKGVQSISFSDISDALWYGVVNIETADLQLTTEVPETDSSQQSTNSFSIQTGDGDGDYPVFALDDASWIDDPNPLRRAWGVCVPFYRKYDDICHKTLVQETEDGRVNLASFTLGYFPDQQEQLVCGKRISYVGNISVEEFLYVSDKSAKRGSGHAIVDVPLHPGKYFIYLIEDTVRNIELDEYMKGAYSAEEWEAQFEDYDVVRIILVVHEDKIGFLNKKVFPLSAEVPNEIAERLKNKDIALKAVQGPNSFNAVMKSMWVSIWSTRYLHATSWTIHGLTFPPEFAKDFESILFEAISQTDSNHKIDLDWCIQRRGINKTEIKLSSRELKQRIGLE